MLESIMHRPAERRESPSATLLMVNQLRFELVGARHLRWSHSSA